MLNLYDILQKVLLEEVSPKNVNDAISNKYRVIINYSDEQNNAPKKRIIEPYAYGLSKAGNSVLRAFQYDGDTKRGKPKWKLFRLDRIMSWQPTSQQFNVSPDENGWSNERYNINGDGSMTTVLNQVKFDNKSNNSYSPNDRLNKERLKTDRLKNSNPININQMKEPKELPISNNTMPTDNINPTNNIEKPISTINNSKNELPTAADNIVTNTNSSVDNTDSNFQKMLKRNMDITQKEKDRRGFSLNKNK